jgi:hypothetical protein
MKLKLASLLLAAGIFAAAVTTVKADSYNITNPAYLSACATLYYAEIAYINAKRSATDGTAIQHAQSAIDDAGKAFLQFNPVGHIIYHGSDIYYKTGEGTFGFLINN